MRKKLSVMLAAITVLALMTAGPGVAQEVPSPCETQQGLVCVTVCIIKDAPIGGQFGGDDNGDNIVPAGTTIELPAEFANDLITDFFPGGPFARLGPCGGSGANGDGGVNGGGGGQQDGGGDNGGGATPITQEGEQESVAGEVDQSFDVS